MKIIKVSEHSLTSGTAKKTVIPLDQRPGLYFRVVCGTYETPFFTKDQKEIPVMMVRGENAQTNVSITCDGNNLTIEQGYMQASFLYLFLCANNDWTDTCELRPVSIDGLDIVKARLTNGKDAALTAGMTGVQVKLTTSGYTPTAANLTAQSITTADGKEYIYPLALSSHAVSSDPIKYDYASATITRVITAYEKSGVN